MTDADLKLLLEALRRIEVVVHKQAAMQSIQIELLSIQVQSLTGIDAARIQNEVSAAMKKIEKLR